jgi:CxxC motif-containing protein (DUF1111 family)
MPLACRVLAMNRGKGMRKPAIVAVALAVGAVVLVAGAQEVNNKINRATFWPALTGTPVVEEWYSDVPWNQKLGTNAGNQIDVALVLPYGALPQDAKDFCTGKNYSQAFCMLEFGIVNILGAYRTDTKYDPDNQKIKDAKECQDASLPCIEVRLDVSNFWTRLEGGKAALQPRTFGSALPVDGYYQKYSIDLGSTYGPQLPWYMSHYCDNVFPIALGDSQDPVCYGDYLSPMNDGFNILPGKVLNNWPNAVTWSVYIPQPPPSGEPSNHCPPGLTVCTMALGGFDLSAVQSDPAGLTYKKYNDNLLAWFNGALKKFGTQFSKADLEHHYPWSGAEVTWEGFVYPQALLNPFQGNFANKPDSDVPAGCDVTVTGPVNQFGDPAKCPNTGNTRATYYKYPNQCTLADLAAASTPSTASVEKLRKCGLNYELHHNPGLDLWPADYQQDAKNQNQVGNQYGRTSFLFGGIPGMQQPVTFSKDANSDSGLSIYEQVYNSSIFSVYLPIANVADSVQGLPSRNYQDKSFYHVLLMTNHMESDPQEFAEGIRGRTLWHNEYRTLAMYDAGAAGNERFPAQSFAASFDPDSAPAPFHNNTCDGCHVRNGSGIPINKDNTLDQALQTFMTGSEYTPYKVKDYSFTGKIRPMKLVFFDLKRDAARVDASRYSEPLQSVIGQAPRGADPYYNSKVMNFYGDSFHVTKSGYEVKWTYKKITDSYRKVVTADRTNAELGTIYDLLQIQLESFKTPGSCDLVTPSPTDKPWPTTCDDVNGDAIKTAIDSSEVGYLLLNGKRLGNLAAMEAIPNEAIKGFRASQVAALGSTIAGELVWNAGSRDGVGGVNSKVQKNCRTNALKDCFIARFGWIGDRVSLEDQVANAAFVEMNMTTTQGYDKLYATDKPLFPIRYKYPNCGPANKACIDLKKGNADLTEQDINRMAAYARWTGSPTRSEFQVALPDVIAGEKIFRQAKCDTCHVIKRIDINPDDTQLTLDFRDRLKTRVAGNAKPFLSYIGTDLLMHDMGYLSQVGNASESIRDSDGVVQPKYKNYVQKIRTPALKGLQFNRFVTDSHNNVAKAGDPACDFLLHDGRACDAIEAAFLHDGPAVKKLGVIDGLRGLNSLNKTELMQLRAFLYSL